MHSYNGTRWSCCLFSRISACMNHLLYIPPGGQNNHYHAIPPPTRKLHYVSNGACLMLDQRIKLIFNNDMLQSSVAPPGEQIIATHSQSSRVPHYCVSHHTARKIFTYLLTYYFWKLDGNRANHTETLTCIIHCKTHYA